MTPFAPGIVIAGTMGWGSAVDDDLSTDKRADPTVTEDLYKLPEKPGCVFISRSPLVSALNGSTNHALVVAPVKR